MYPLAGVDPANITQGGYDFLQWTGDTYHPGVDLNTPGGPFSDRGLTVSVNCGGIVRFVEGWDGTTKGFGSHVWVEHLGDIWTHYCHLGGLAVSSGILLERGDPIGVCGGSGGWIDHLHFEVLRARPQNWWLWPKGWALGQVAALYLDPLAWLREQDQMAELRRIAAVAAALELAGVRNVKEMTDAQAQSVGQYLWGKTPFVLANGIARAYIDDLRNGAYRGIPVGGEHVAADGAVVQKFRLGVTATNPNVIGVYTPEGGAWFAA